MTLLFLSAAYGASSVDPRAYMVEDDRFPGIFHLLNTGYLPILEHSCIKHIRAGRIRRAHEVLYVANWQCVHRERITIPNTELNNMDRYAEELQDAHRLATKNGEQWICNPPPIPLTKQKQFFYTHIAKQVREHLESIGISEDGTTAILAQIVQETAWGRSIVGNNLFNIKGTFEGATTNFTTHEQLPDGSWIKIQDKFRKYPSYAHAIDDYFKVLRKKWPTAHAALYSSKTAFSIDVFLNGLHAGKKGGYATDQRYAGKLQQLTRQIHRETNPTELPTYLFCLDRSKDFYTAVQRTIPWLTKP